MGLGNANELEGNEGCFRIFDRDSHEMIKNANAKQLVWRSAQDRRKPRSKIETGVAEFTISGQNGLIGFRHPAPIAKPLLSSGFVPIKLHCTDLHRPALICADLATAFEFSIGTQAKRPCPGGRLCLRTLCLHGVADHSKRE